MKDKVGRGQNRRRQRKKTECQFPKLGKLVKRVAANLRSNTVKCVSYLPGPL